MRITLNGRAIETRSTSVAALLCEREMSLIGVAVARNGAVVRRADHASATLREGDTIEIIQAVQGG